MSLDGALGDEEFRRHFLDGKTLGRKQQNFALARRELFQFVRRGVDRVGDGGVEINAAADHRLQGLRQLHDRRGLDDEASRAGRERRHDIRLGVVGREHDDFRRQLGVLDFAGDGDAVHFGHADIEQGHVGPELFDHFPGLFAVGRFAEQIESFFFVDESGQTGAGERMVVGQND